MRLSKSKPLYIKIANSRFNRDKIVSYEGYRAGGNFKILIKTTDCKSDPIVFEAKDEQQYVLSVLDEYFKILDLNKENTNYF